MSEDKDYAWRFVTAAHSCLLECEFKPDTRYEGLVRELSALPPERLQAISGTLEDFVNGKKDNQRIYDRFQEEFKDKLKPFSESRE